MESLIIKAPRANNLPTMDKLFAPCLHIFHTFLHLKKGHCVHYSEVPLYHTTSGLNFCNSQIHHLHYHHHHPLQFNNYKMSSEKRTCFSQRANFDWAVLLVKVRCGLTHCLAYVMCLQYSPCIAYRAAVNIPAFPWLCSP